MAEPFKDFEPRSKIPAQMESKWKEALSQIEVQCGDSETMARLNDETFRELMALVNPPLPLKSNLQDYRLDFRNKNGIAESGERIDEMLKRMNDLEVKFDNVRLMLTLNPWRRRGATVWSGSDPSNRARKFREKSLKFYGLAPNAPVCMATGQILAEEGGKAGHIFPHSEKNSPVLATLKMSSKIVDKPKNSLFLCVEVEEAFDALSLGIVYDPFQPSFEQRFVLRILDPQAKKKVLQNGKTLGDYDGRPLSNVSEKAHPSLTLLNLHWRFVLEEARIHQDPSWISQEQFEAYIDFAHLSESSQIDEEESLGEQYYLMKDGDKVPKIIKTIRMLQFSTAPAPVPAPVPAPAPKPVQKASRPVLHRNDRIKAFRDGRVQPAHFLAWVTEDGQDWAEVLFDGDSQPLLADPDFVERWTGKNKSKGRKKK